MSVATPAQARTEQVGETTIVDTRDDGSSYYHTLAHNTDEDEYLAIYRNRFGNESISGILLDAEGDVISGPTVLVAPDDPTPVNSNDQITNNPPSVAYNPVTDQYVIAFDRGDSAFAGGDVGQSNNVMARLVSDTGVPVGGEVRISPDFSTYYFCSGTTPDVAFDPNGGGYLFTYSKSRFFAEQEEQCPGIPPATSSHLTLLQPVSADLSPGAVIRTPNPGPKPGTPRVYVEVNPTDGSFMITEPHDDTTGYAYLYNPDRTLRREIRLEQPDPRGNFGPAFAAADPATGNWLITWRQNRVNEQYTMVVDAAGDTLVEPYVGIPDNQVGPLAAVGDGTFVTMGSSPAALIHLDGRGRAFSVEPIDDAQVSTAGFAPINGLAVDATTTPSRVVAVAGSATDGDVAVVVADVVAPGPLPLVPARLLETRDGPGLTTIDGRFEGGGTLAAGRTLTLDVAGRGGVPGDAEAVMLNIAAAGASRNGFVTAFPCDAPERPTTSNLNFSAGAASSAAAFATLSEAGTVCLFTSTAIDMIVDVNGHVPAGGSVTPIVPGRLLDTRPNQSTIDGRQAGIGAVRAGSVTPVDVAGRAGVATDADAAIVNVTVVGPATQNFVTVFPCGAQQPNSANLNAPAGGLANNAALAKIGEDGRICVFSSSDTDMVVDVSAFVPADGGLSSIVPARLVDTRPGTSTVDGADAGSGPLAAGSETRFRVAGRDDVPGRAQGVMLNVAAIKPSSGGFLTLHPCGERPQAANLNVAADSIVSNAVFVKLATTGDVCVFSSMDTDVTIDVVGFTLDG